VSKWVIAASIKNQNTLSSTRSKLAMQQFHIVALAHELSGRLAIVINGNEIVVVPNLGTVTSIIDDHGVPWRD